jgi:hypothetical protein
LAQTYEAQVRFQTATRRGLLIDQYTTSYGLLLERLQGLTDAEYFWEPTPGCWSIRRRSQVPPACAVGQGDWVMEDQHPAPTPAPITTLAWRLCHLVSGQMMRCDYTFGTKSLIWNDIEFPGSADAALAFLERSHEAWYRGLDSLSEADLDIIGLSSFPQGLDPTLPFGAIFWWTNRELIHHGGEIALLRDLWLAHQANHRQP